MARTAAPMACSTRWSIRAAMRASSHDSKTASATSPPMTPARTRIRMKSSPILDLHGHALAARTPPFPTGERMAESERSSGKELRVARRHGAQRLGERLRGRRPRRPARSGGATVTDAASLATGDVAGVAADGRPLRSTRRRRIRPVTPLGRIAAPGALPVDARPTSCCHRRPLPTTATAIRFAVIALRFAGWAASSASEHDEYEPIVGRPRRHNNTYPDRFQASVVAGRSPAPWQAMLESAGWREDRGGWRSRRGVASAVDRLERRGALVRTHCQERSHDRAVTTGSRAVRPPSARRDGSAGVFLQPSSSKSDGAAAGSALFADIKGGIAADEAAQPARRSLRQTRSPATRLLSRSGPKNNGVDSRMFGVTAASRPIRSIGVDSGCVAVAGPDR